MKYPRTLHFLLTSAVLFSASVFRAAAVDDVIITEFMAENDNTLLDEDGDTPDWIELFNAGTNTVNLNGWYLSDALSANVDNYWRFPATNLPPQGFLVVFASGKDRRVPGLRLHTDFALNDNGEHVFLIKPDGVTIASQYAANGGEYPRQAPGVSYGIPVTQTLSTLVASGASGKYFVPLSGSVDGLWLQPEFNDASWTSATTGVGYETDAATNIVIASSTADWSTTGTQGEKNWHYGYYNKTLDPGGVYQASNFIVFPRNAGAFAADNYWTGSMWDWFAGNPPWDEISQTGGHPNGSNNSQEHWVIRRWVSKVSGTITVDWFLAKANTGGGNGVTGRIFHNNTQRDSVTIAFNNGAGTNKSIVITGVQVGDTIDYALDAFGTDNTANDGSDGSLFSMTIKAPITLSNQINTTIVGMKDVSSSAYLRIPFVVTNAATYDLLSLRMKYDDGFAAYLNTVPLVVRNSPGSPAWNSTATESRNDIDASQFEEINVTPALGALRDGTNILAIHGLNLSAGDSDFLMLPELRAGVTAFDRNAQRYFVNPTPGTPNDVGTTNLGPLVFNIEHTPKEPADSEDLVVTAEARVTFNAVSNLTLVYKIMFNNDVAVRMNDSGTNGDLLGGDGIYSGIIPASVSTPGQMIRYFVRADDVFGSFTRQPASSNSVNAPAYFGTVVSDPSVVTPLPVLHLFIPQATLNLANNDSAGRYLCSIYYLGEFYDNIGINRHGQSSAGFPKKSYDLDFNPGNNFKWKEGEDLVDDVNLLTTYPDKAHMRNMLAYETLRDAGSPYHFVEPIRMQTNGAFYGDWHLVENGDDNYLQRIGRDPNGAFYKMYNQFLDPSDYTLAPNSEAEKKTRKNESNADLIALFNGVNAASLATRTNYMYDNINIAEVLNTLAGRTVTADWDCCHKNYYFYRDSDGTGEWEAMPWDIDLSFGRNWSSSQSYWDDAVYPGNRIWGNWDNNGFFRLVLNMPLGTGIDATRQMYLRRVRTLMDELQQTNGTPATELRYEKRIDELAAILEPDAAIDLLKWGTWGGGATGIFDPNNQFYRTLPQSVAQLKTNYMPARRNFIFNQNMGLTGADLFNWTNAQPTNVVILIDSLDYNPASRNQAEEYIRLVNTNRIAVDISGWRLGGAVEHTFQGGVVIPGSNSVYVVPDKKAFRARASAPRGGMGLYIEGPYKGQLSARGETIYLSNKLGQVVRTNLYIGNPSGPQQYLRVTEIMYHPPKGGAAPDSELYEYIELRNIGPSTLDLTGVRFTNGISFTFAGSAVTNLAAGQRVLVVRNIAHFTERYGSGLNVAGEFEGVLDNAGENIQIDDANNEKVLDFDYDNAWYPVTDGPGASLVIKDDTADWHTWNLAASWRPSAFDFGSPGQPDPTPIPASPVIVNEVLTHTDLPQVDAVEILNPTATPANIGGWFLSDDFASPKKYRIPDGTTIAPNSYTVFYESNTFGLGPNAFAYSSKGDEVFLFSGNGTNITGYLHGYSVEAAANGVSFGRYTNSQTNVHFVAQTTLSLGSANGSPKVGPVVISEINYHPAELAIGQDNQLDEYVELANISGSTVPLFDAGNLTSWRLRGGVDFEFPANASIEPGGHILVVSFNPAYTPILAAFRARNNVSPQVPVFGPFRGSLDNDGENVRLYRPDTPETNEVPYILVDRVDYDDELPWGAAADGIGPSLQKRVESAYGNDATNWIASVASPGVAYVAGGDPPSIVTPPASVTDIIGRTVSFSVGVSGTPPFSYRWRRNGEFIPGAFGQTLTLPNIQLNQAGNYSVIVFNSAGSTESSSATLTVLVPVSIGQHPGSLKMRGSTNVADYGNATNNATFSVGANIQRPTRFQWRFNGLPISNATNATLVVSNVNFNQHEGTYDVVVTDDVSSATSGSAKLTVLLSPTILVAPPNNYVVASNGSISASVVIRGNPPPYYFRWNEQSTTRVSATNDLFTNFMTYGPITNFAPRTWRAIITNEANVAPTANAQFTVAAALDTDRDGIPDSWEAGYGFGTNNLADATLDSDDDGMSNRAEYLAGTNPTNSASYLRVEGPILGGGATVSFGAVSNRTYSVLYSDSLTIPVWLKLGDVQAKNADHAESLTDPGGNTNRFYRVVTPAQ